MASRFDLIITADSPEHGAEFRLLDEHGAQLAYRQTDFKTLSASRQRSLFDLRNFLRHFVVDAEQADAVAEVGVAIAQEVLGPDIFGRLWASQSQRTLRIQLPGAGEHDNHLAAALARVPWEIARPSAGQDSLGERNLLVRVVHEMAAPASEPLDLAADEVLRVLFVFAEARGSRPLGARQERRDLLRLLEAEVYPKRRVIAHFLTHGVTRQRLASQIRDHGGYHVVHWSGHGHLNLLELSQVGGASDHLSGDELLELFADAGGFLPRLVFLSACHSGDILQVKDWSDFLAVAQGQEPGGKEAGSKEVETRTLDLAAQPGFTGTAHALLQGGVLSVVGMRFAVSDDYARELSVEFYRALLADSKPKSAAAALTLARSALHDPKRHDPTRFAVCDHATPLLYGAEQPGLMLVAGRSTELNQRQRRLHAIGELTTAGHQHFVGRTWELAGLGAEFLGSSDGAEVKPVAVITGLGGMGKTSLVAEALALWESRFEWLLLYQSKPEAVGFEGWLRDIDLRLRGRLKLYHEHVKAYPADAVYRDADASFTGLARLEELTRNLVRALQAEPILLVLDNFETHLKPQPGPAGASCQDPAWDQCLALLAQELVGSPSRVLITCRRPLAALGGGLAHLVQLGPLPPAEAALYLRTHPVLSRMVFGGDPAERALAMRLLNASRFHPLLMDRLARLATEISLRPQLGQALDTLEASKDFEKLPELFAVLPGNTKELAYLNDALTSSLDQLIREASPDERRALWMIAVANEPVALRLLEGVWSGEDHRRARLRQIKSWLDNMTRLPEELQEHLRAMPSDVRAELERLPPQAPPTPELHPLLLKLVGVGLASEERIGPNNIDPVLSCHELVRERIRRWMTQAPQDHGGWTDRTVRLAYADRLEATFRAQLHQDMSIALQAGGRALVYCVQAQAWDRLVDFASSVVTGTSDVHLLERLIPHLRTAAEAAPEGRQRWICLGQLADALNSSGRPDASLPFFERSVQQIRAYASSTGANTQQAWSDLSSTVGNWANALFDLGELETARQLQLESADAAERAGKPAIYCLVHRLEALRIDVQQGHAAAVLPQVESGLAQVETWWKLHGAGENVPQAPGAELLIRAYTSALDVANDAHRALGQWDAALKCTDSMLNVLRTAQRSAQELARVRLTRAVELGQVQRFDEARQELETCLQIFEDNPKGRASALSALAGILNKQGDTNQAITQERRSLAAREQLPDPGERSISHLNLANYLQLQGMAVADTEASGHRLAGLIYLLVAGLGQAQKAALHNYALVFKRGHAAGSEPPIPLIAQLLGDPVFQPLKGWLYQRQVNLPRLQSEVDLFLHRAKQIASEQDSPI